MRPEISWNVNLARGSMLCIVFLCKAGSHVRCLNIYTHVHKWIICFHIWSDNVKSYARRLNAPEVALLITFPITRVQAELPVWLVIDQNTWHMVREWCQRIVATRVNKRNSNKMLVNTRRKSVFRATFCDRKYIFAFCLRHTPEKKRKMFIKHADFFFFGIWCRKIFVLSRYSWMEKTRY